jgi:hypothetical protein
MVSEENVTEEPNVIIVYKTYTPALKKAQQKYYEANKQKIIDRNVNHYRGKSTQKNIKNRKQSIIRRILKRKSY